MFALIRKVLLVLVMSLALATGALSDFLPTSCMDECAGEVDGCGDCNCCAPVRAPVLLEQPDSGFVEACSTHETLDPVRPSRSEERGVFHVPRHDA